MLAKISKFKDIYQVSLLSPDNLLCYLEIRLKFSLLLFVLFVFVLVIAVVLFQESENSILKLQWILLHINSKYNYFIHSITLKKNEV